MAPKGTLVGAQSSSIKRLTRKQKWYKEQRFMLKFEIIS